MPIRNIYANIDPNSTFSPTLVPTPTLTITPSPAPTSSPETSPVQPQAQLADVVQQTVGVVLQERAIISVILVFVLAVTAYFMFRDLKHLQKDPKNEPSR